MNNIVSFSGGRTSAYLVYVIEGMRQRGEIDNVHYVFMDTGAEHPKTYEFIKNVVNHFKIDLVCIRAKINPKHGVGTTYQIVDEIGCDMKPWKDFVNKYGTPYSHIAHCTARLKTDPYEKWIKENFKEYTTWLGIRADEPQRLRKRPNVKYLADVSDYEKEDILEFWRSMPFDLNLSEWLGNCVFCVKKGTNKIALAAMDEPEMAKQFHDILASDKVKTLPSKTSPNENCFRNSMSIPQIIESYRDESKESLISSLRGNSGACSESCEAMEYQKDLFKDS